MTYTITVHLQHMNNWCDNKQLSEEECDKEEIARWIFVDECKNARKYWMDERAKKFQPERRNFNGSVEVTLWIEGEDGEMECLEDYEYTREMHDAEMAAEEE